MSEVCDRCGGTAESPRMYASLNHVALDCIPADLDDAFTVCEDCGDAFEAVVADWLNPNVEVTSERLPFECPVHDCEETREMKEDMQEHYLSHAEAPIDAELFTSRGST